MNDDESDSGGDRAGDIAIDWWVRLSAGELTCDEQAAFDLWIASDPVNAAAFNDVLRMCGKLSALPRPARSNRARSASRRFWLAGAGVLAAASLALLVGFDDLYVCLRADYYVGAGAPKLVTLADGSHVQLDARSAIKVNYAANERRLTLIEGEAWFEVAPDPARPFVVEAAGATISALGTAFDVALEKARARVVVTQHRVSIFSGGKCRRWRRRGELFQPRRRGLAAVASRHGDCHRLAKRDVDHREAAARRSSSCSRSLSSRICLLRERRDLRPARDRRVRHERSASSAARNRGLPWATYGPPDRLFGFII